MQLLGHTLMVMFFCGAMVSAIVMQSATLRAQQASVGQDMTAIDVLLEPDATMLKHAEANNARLLAVFPKGFALDATHRPHLSLIHI